MTERERQILALIQADPLISQQAIAEKLTISRSAVAGHVMHMTDKGIIKGRGYVLGGQPFVVALGGANMDVHGRPDAATRTRDSNPGTVRTSPGGVARNIAENLVRLGVDCRLVAPLGRDHYGDLLLSQGRAAGIDMRHVMRVDGRATSTYLSVLDEAGDMQVAISDMSIMDTLDARQLERQEPMLRQAAIIVADANLCDSALAWLASRFSDQPLFIDTVSASKANRIEPYLGAVHTVFPSLIEAEALSEVRGRGKRGLKSIAGWFHHRGVRRVFVTLGRKGVFFSADGKSGMIEAERAETAVNTSGAGDAFAAGMTAAWLKSWPLEKSVRFGMAAASHTLADPATVSPTLSDGAVRRLFEQHHAA